MNRRLLRALLALYPPAWRDRYGAELAGLTEDLISTGQIRPLPAAVNLAGAAALEWARVLAGSRRVVGPVAVAGLVAGIVFAALHPPLQTSTALVIVAPAPQSVQAGAGNGAADPSMATQVVIADSDPVLSNALRHARPAMTLSELQRNVQIESLARFILSVSATGENAADAEATANAVADSYIGYVSSPDSPVGDVRAEMLEVATTAAGRPLPVSLLIMGGLGALFGSIAGTTVALALGRADRRFEISR